MLAGAVAAAALAVSVPGFQLERVNSEVSSVRDGGSHHLCQAIPVTVVRATLRWRNGPATVRAQLRAPQRGSRTRKVALRGRRGSTRVAWSPADLGLRDFTEGRYTVTVLRRDGHVLDRGRFTLTGGGTC